MRTVVPSRLPYVVPLVRFIETEDAIFLVLDLAKGGRLWNYIRLYLSAKARRLGKQRLSEVSKAAVDVTQSSREERGADGATLRRKLQADVIEHGRAYYDGEQVLRPQSDDEYYEEDSGGESKAAERPRPKSNDAGAYAKLFYSYTAAKMGVGGGDASPSASVTTGHGVTASGDSSAAVSRASVSDLAEYVGPLSRVVRRSTDVRGASGDPVTQLPVPANSASTDLRASNGAPILNALVDPTALDASDLVHKAKE